MKPLSGVRVVAVEQFGAAPYASMFLADLGAEVIKIENCTTRGDPARHTGPWHLGEADSQYFQTWNSNKFSVALDLRSDADRRALLDLVASADALVNNLRGDLPTKMGLDYAQLATANMAIVCLHISAYGRDNERASWPGYDYLMQAESGLMSLTGEPDGPPSRMGAPSMVDHVTGITGLVGLLAALFNAQRTGYGCDVDVCLFDVALHQLGYSAIWSLNENYDIGRQPRSAHLAVTPVQTFPTADGWIFVMCMTEKFWQTLVDELSASSLRDDPRFATPAARHTHREEMTVELDRFFRQHPSQYWLSRLQGRLPVAPVLTVREALTNPFVTANGMISNVSHPARAEFRMLSNPLKIDGERPAQRVCAALGRDNVRFVNNASANKGDKPK